MKHIFVGLMLLSSVALGEGIGPKNLIQTPGTNPQINAATLATTRTFSWTQNTGYGTYSVMSVYVSIADTDNSTTALTMTCTASIDDNTTVYSLQDCTTASGVCTSSNASWTKDPSGITSPKRWVWRIGMEGFEDIKCSFTNTGGTAADTITVNVATSVAGS